MRYRYIFSGEVKATDNISDYRLLDRQKMQGTYDVIRIEIPDNAILEKWACDEYSTWSSKNKKDYQLNELNPKICIKINGKWEVSENATKDWLAGKALRISIHDNIEGNYRQTPMFNIGYLTKEQYVFYQNNYKYAWRFDRLPTDLSNVNFPPLTSSQLETLSFVRTQLHQYYEETIEESSTYDIEEKAEARNFFKNFIENISNDDLAYEWHRYSINSLDPNKKFETKEMVDKLKRSPYSYVSEDHYKYAVEKIIDNMAHYFYSNIRYKETETDIER